MPIHEVIEKTPVIHDAFVKFHNNMIGNIFDI